nr:MULTISPECIES: transposase [unclassified Neisseria]
MFEAWFEHILLPELMEKSIIIMDNISFHHVTVLAETAEKQRYKALLSAPCLPEELNLIEKAWADIKKHLRKVLPDREGFTGTLLRYEVFIN